MLPIALQAGMTKSQFWDSTIEETNEIIEAHNQKQKLWARQNYEAARLQALFVGCILSGEPIPELEEVYPIFDNTTKQEELQAKEDLRIAIMKEQMRDFANGRNRQIKDG